jgi:hypothetical protein
MKTLLSMPILLIVLLNLSAPAMATSSPTQITACHLLMTQQECSQFKTHLEQLRPGPERDQFLLAHADSMHAREAACSCDRKLMAEIIYLPKQQTDLIR